MSSERRGPDPSKPGTVYRSRPRLFRRGGDGLDGLRGQLTPPGGVPGRPDAGPSGASSPGGSLPGGPPGRLSSAPPAVPKARRTGVSWKLVALVVAVVVLVVYPLTLATLAWTHLGKVAALPPSRPADTPGRNYLVVGSDSRNGLTAEQRHRLSTGKVGGGRTDTIMLLHVPSGGGPTVLVSIPRDSYVAIPGHGKNKINSAYAFGGPQLLVRTVEQATGVTVDEYVETGLGGYADLVDAIGGVHVCSPRAFDDKKAGLHIPKGCQDMAGATALGYARARYSDPRGDLGRVERQRQILAAIAGKTLSPSVLLLPWRSLAAASAGGSALVVDDGTSPIGLARFILAMRAVSGGNGVSLTVPIGNAALRTPAGEAVSWDTAKAKQLFAALKSDDTAAVVPLAAEQKR